MSQQLVRGPPTIGIHVPAVSTDTLGTRDAYARFFQEAERLGFDALWAEDRILHPAHLADPVVLLTLAAAHTEKMRLGTAVMVLNLRQAPVLARQLATLNHFSEDRLVVGLSIGGRPDEYAAMGIDPTTRISRFNESFAVLQGLLQGVPFDHEGAAFHLAKAVVRPAATVPIWLGGVVEAALRRAGRLADGWIMAPFGTLRDFARSWDIVREAAQVAGRDPQALSAGRLLYVAVDGDAARARKTLGRFIDDYYAGNVVDVDRDGIFGPVESVAERLQAQLDAGIEHLMLGVPNLDLEHLRRLAEVRAQLKAV